MPKIEHCGASRRTTIHWLYTDSDYFDFDILLEATCPKCSRTIWETSEFRYESGFAPGRRIRHERLAYWMERKKNDTYKTQEPGIHKPDRDTSVIIFESEYTMAVHREPESSQRYLKWLEKRKRRLFPYRTEMKGCEP